MQHFLIQKIYGLIFVFLTLSSFNPCKAKANCMFTLLTFATDYQNLCRKL